MSQNEPIIIDEVSEMPSKQYAFKDEATGIEYPTLEDLQDKRIVKTNDAKGFAYADGNRATRRGIYKQLRTGTTTRGANRHDRQKQYHKLGHT